MLTEKVHFVAVVNLAVDRAPNGAACEHKHTQAQSQIVLLKPFGIASLSALDHRIMMSWSTLKVVTLLGQRQYPYCSPIYHGMTYWGMEAPTCH